MCYHAQLCSNNYHCGGPTHIWIYYTFIAGVVLFITAGAFFVCGGLPCAKELVSKCRGQGSAKETKRKKSLSESTHREVRNSRESIPYRPSWEVNRERQRWEEVQPTVVAAVEVSATTADATVVQAEPVVQAG